MLNLNFEPFPQLKTPRLLLRQVLPTDAQAVMNIRGNEEAMRYIPRPRAKTVDDALAVIKMLTDGINEQKSINWAIANINNPSEIFGIIGFVNLYTEQRKAEIGYMLHPDYWGNGYVPEAILAVENFGFTQMNLKSIEAKIDPRNENSKKVLTRNHYQVDRIVKKETLFLGEELDAAYYIKHPQ